MKPIMKYLAIVVVVCMGSMAYGKTVAYWRFDDMRDPEIVAEVGTVASGVALPDSDGQTVWRKAVNDWSGNGNHLTTWDYAWAGHEWSDDVPSTVIPALGLDNALSIKSAGNYPAMMTWSAESHPTGVDLETWSPDQFTIEASFKLTDISGYHTIVGRDGSEVCTVNTNGVAESALAPFYLSVRHGNGTLGVVMVDVAGYEHVVESDAGFIKTNQWYNVVAVSDGVTLSLYCDNVDVNSVDMTQSGTTDTHLAIGTTSDAGWHSGTWTVTRGLYNGAHTDRVYGWVDEVSISDVALTPDQFLFGKASPKAQKPYPVNSEQDAARDLILHWSPGAYETTHNLYFGTDENEVLNSTTSLAADLDVNSYDVGRLELGHAYYWRVDEVNVTSDHTVTPGNVWAFKVEPVAYAIDGANITATASSENTGQEAQKTVDGSGLDAQDRHSTTDTDMWFSAEDDAGPVWIEYAFDQVYTLHEMWVWNCNSELEPILGFGIKNAHIEVSTDGNDWTVIDPNVLLADANGTDVMAPTSKIALNDVSARYVRITALSNWSTVGVTQCALSEVRFYSVPLAAYLPQPADGATGVAVTRSLAWRSGRKAVSHNVYFSTDVNAVADGNALAGTVDRAAFDLSGQGVTFGQTYYWRVDEVNGVNVVPGDVWSFSTPEYVVVEDMESYNDTDNLIYEAWGDGYGNDNNGSQVGYITAPFAEQSIVHGGSQSMPFNYSNSGSVISTAVRDFGDADWDQGGLQQLSLFFRGDPANQGGQFFIEVDGHQAVCDFPLNLPLWRRWNVDLAGMGVDLNHVHKVTIGVQGVGSGLIYLDDLRLYHEAPAMLVPVDPGTDNLTHLYTFDDGTAADSVGGADGSLVGAGIEVIDGDLVTTSQDSWMEMPGDVIDMNSYDAVSLEMWYTPTDGANTGFSMLAYFGDSTDPDPLAGLGANGLFMTSARGDDVSRAAISCGDTSTPWSAETGVSGPEYDDGKLHHMVATFSATQVTLYIDGAKIGSAPMAANNSIKLISNNFAYLAKGGYGADPEWIGAIHKFAIYNKALSENEVLFLYFQGD